MKPEYVPKTLEQKLGYLIEECGEVLQAVGKAQRWGLESRNVELPVSDANPTNRQWILAELADLRRAIKYVWEEIDGRDPVHYWTGPGDILPGWYFWDETWADRVGPFLDEDKARGALRRYTKSI